ncbi:MAG: hypothetical protein GXO85_12575 [Chlorobi bacterium]|nr:hypothetical protein [Chlorobiota bacterium]
MIEYLPQALSSLSAARVIAKSFLDLRDLAQINSKVVELQDIIMAAQEKVFAAQEDKSLLAAKVQELEEECTRLKDWSTEKEKYLCKEIAPGVFAYIRNDFNGQFENAYKLCCNCFDRSIKSTLQQSQIKTYRNMIKLDCSNGCHEIIFTDYNYQE